MKDLEIKDIESIDFLLENVESVKFYQSEIKEINVVFEDRMERGGDGAVRVVKSGFIKIAIDEKLNAKRDVNFHDFSKRKPKTTNILKRLVGACDICRFIVEEVDIHWREDIQVPYEEKFDDDDCEIGMLVCSSVKVDNNGDLIIFMGESSELDCENVKPDEIHKDSK